MMVETHSKPPALTVYFDGACPVCSREIAYYRRQPGADACAWVDAAACTEPALGPGLTRSAALGRFHVRRADGKLVDGMRGFAALWQVLPRTAWLGRLASFGPVPRLLDAAYRAFLALRPLWRSAGPRAAPTSASGIATYSPEQHPTQRARSGSLTALPIQPPEA